MKVDFQRLDWENYPSTNTPLNADNLNRLEEGVAGLYSDVAEIEEELGEGVGEYVTGWLTEHVDPVGSAVVVDDTLTIQGAAADAKKTGDEISSLKEDFNQLNGDILFNGTHSYAGGAENWGLFDMGGYGSSKFAIKLYTNDANVPFEVAIHTASPSVWVVLTTITDNLWHIVDIPASVDNKFILTYRGSSAVTLSCIVAKVTKESFENDIIRLENDIDTIEGNFSDFLGTERSYGNNGETETGFGFNLNFTACPCKRAEKTGLVESLYVRSYASGTTEVYIGEVDQSYLFVPRTSFSIDLESGEKTYDISDLNIYINEGEQILIKFIGGQTPFAQVTGEPEGDNSFYYSSAGTMQLEVFAAQKAAVFGFGYVVRSSSFTDVQAQVMMNSQDIDVIQGNIDVLQSTQNVISDRQGNKYKMIVQNGEITLLDLEFSHVLCVGNSYTVHPTTDDTEPDYANNLWWGHWSMAASSHDTAWTTLLQTALQQKDNSAVVTPVFGRRYETNPSTYTLNVGDTFTYWDGTQWKGLKNNRASFSDVDAIVFFLGANYSGDNWYSLYSAMLEKFLEWFPSATLFCCSCSSSYNATKDTAIQQAASEQSATFINMVGLGGKSKIGSYVYGDDDDLHQINNAAVANHFGDYGEYLILDRVCTAMGYSNNTSLYHITISNVSGVTLTVISSDTISGAVVSVFAEVTSGTTLSSITVTDASNNNVTVTDHGVTDYGRVFTFEMPSANVTITGNVS